VVPALAGESFHAFSQLPALEQAALTPLPDAQLATIEGTELNSATVIQVNVAVGNHNYQLQVNVASDKGINSERQASMSRTRYSHTEQRLGDFIDQLHAAAVRQGIFQRNWTTGTPGLQVNSESIRQSSR
ncbi:MAG: hypothetical protein M3328_16450, partial [Chloroflexota bacterium]|nr:hypothetical protein [Chloroflexota bacterium]